MLWQAARWGYITGRGALEGAGVSIPVNTVLPVISGTPSVTMTLTTTTGTWVGTPTITYAYQWKRNGSSIGGATSNSYLLVIADLATTITVTVTATNGLGNASATSAGVGPIGTAPATARSAMLTGAFVNTSTTQRMIMLNRRPVSP